MKKPTADIPGIYGKISQYQGEELIKSAVTSCFLNAVERGGTYVKEAMDHIMVRRTCLRARTFELFLLR